MITKVLLSGVIMFGAAVGAAIPAYADPSVFGNLSCSCEEPATARIAGLPTRIR